MRKIAQDIAQAIRQNRSVCKGNTYYDADQGRVYLHGHCILFKADGVFMVHMGTVKQWNTNTTRSRINDLCSLFGAYHVVARQNWELKVNPDAHLQAHRWLDGAECGALIAFNAPKA